MNSRAGQSKYFGKRQGFSRLELVLIGATAIGTLLALPAMSQQGWWDVFGRARENARRSSCQSNLKQTALAILQYSQDYDEKLPTIASAPPKGNYGWAENILPYAKNREVFSCPSDRHPLGQDSKKPRYTDYWFNTKLNGLETRWLTAASRTLLMGDGDGNSPQSNARYNLNTLPKSWITTKGSPVTRHLGGAIYSFVDGHVKWFLPKAISTASPVKNKSVSATFAIK